MASPTTSDLKVEYEQSLAAAKQKQQERERLMRKARLTHLSARDQVYHMMQEDVAPTIWEQYMEKMEPVGYTELFSVKIPPHIQEKINCTCLPSGLEISQLSHVCLLDDDHIEDLFPDKGYTKEEFGCDTMARAFAESKFNPFGKKLKVSAPLGGISSNGCTLHLEKE